jgi:hypothetical protein
LDLSLFSKIPIYKNPAILAIPIPSNSFNERRCFSPVTIKQEGSYNLEECLMKKNLGLDNPLHRIYKKHPFESRRNRFEM